MAVAILLAGYPILRSATGRPLMELLAASGGLLLFVALGFASPRAVPWCAGVLGAEYLASLYLGPPGADGWAALYGAGLLLMAELASMSAEPGFERERSVLFGRLGAIALLVVFSAGLSALLMVVGLIPIAGALALTATGAAGVVLALAIVAALSWRGMLLSARPRTPRSAQRPGT